MLQSNYTMVFTLAHCYSQRKEDALKRLLQLSYTLKPLTDRYLQSLFCKKIYCYGVYPIIKQKVCERDLSRMDMHENPFIKHSISVQKSVRVFANPLIKHPNSSKTLK